MFAVDAASLGGRRLWHGAEYDRSHCETLTGPVKGEWCGGGVVFHDATLDVSCLRARAPIEGFASDVLLQCLPQMLQPLLFFSKLLVSSRSCSR